MGRKSSFSRVTGIAGTLLVITGAAGQLAQIASASPSYQLTAQVQSIAPAAPARTAADVIRTQQGLITTAAHTAAVQERLAVAKADVEVVVAVISETKAEQQAAAQQAAEPVTVQQPQQQAGGVTYVSVSGVGGAFGACVRSREEGGRYVWGPGNGGGAYQFQLATWEKYNTSRPAGTPASYGYGTAGPAYQDQVFLNAIAAGGQGNWAPYDGC